MDEIELAEFLVLFFLEVLKRLPSSRFSSSWIVVPAPLCLVAFTPALTRKRPFFSFLDDWLSCQQLLCKGGKSG